MILKDTRMKKKVIMGFLLFTLLLIYSPLLFSIKVAAKENGKFTKNAVHYTIIKKATSKEKGNVSISYNDNKNKSIQIVKIPKTVKYKNHTYNVTTIKSSAFIKCSSLVKVIIPKGVITIEKNAFKQCSKLKCVLMADSVTAIDNKSFRGCSEDIVFYCSENSVAYNFVQDNDLKYKLIKFGRDNTIVNDKNKLILVGDSRTNNMSKWVNTSIPTKFIAKSGEGYKWFSESGISRVNNTAKPGDVIIVWLGVNDYSSKILGDNSWLLYSNKINSLAKKEWSDCNVYVASVGYVDKQKIEKYFGNNIKSNEILVHKKKKIIGIQIFNKKIKSSLDDKITWIDTNKIIGIKGSDSVKTSSNIWLTRKNGKKDGLHYGKIKTQEIYDFFVKKSMILKTVN